MHIYVIQEMKVGPILQSIMVNYSIVLGVLY